MTAVVALLAPGAAELPDATWTVLGGPDPQPSMRDLERAVGQARSTDVLVLGQPGRWRAAHVDLDRAADLAVMTGDLDGPLIALRTEELRRHDLRPLAGIGADVAGPLLAAQYLVAVGRSVALVPLRRRPAAEPDWSERARFDAVPQAYADLLERVAAESAGVPEWLQRLVAGQLLGYLREHYRLFSPSAGLPPELTEPFHVALPRILAHLDDAVIASHPGEAITREMRLILVLAGRPGNAHASPARRPDAGRGLVRISYPFVGEPPSETVTRAGAPLAPEHHKIRTVQLLGRVVMRERIMWLPEDADVEIDPTGEVALTAPPPARVARYRRIVAENSGLATRLAGDARIRLLARRRAEHYRDAWLLMDRDTFAQDNAEHLYRHLAAHEPDVNAFFVLRRTSRDWARLAGEGFRLIDFGSDEHFAALLNCAHLVSSQVDDYVVKPFAGHLLGPARWRYTFLQHGVLEHDMSRWLNRKSIDVFITSIPDEQRSVVADGTSYVFTDLETVMTGLARHDRLLRLAGEVEQNWLAVMPTWRGELLGPQAFGNRRAPVENFWASDYARGWRALLESERLRELCERVGWQLTFVPHPNMQDYLATSPLPPHVVTHRFDSIDVQEVIARSAVLVSDYSSLTMEGALLVHPIVYYQFDREAFYGGQRLYQRGGEWTFERDGFGPVTSTADEAVVALEQIAQRGGPDSVYGERMTAAFPYRDGRCCERVTAAIKAITTR